MEKEKKKKKKVVLFPSPGAGHVVAMVELSKQILRHSPDLSIIIFNLPPYNSPTSFVDPSAAAPGLDVTFIDFPVINHQWGDTPIGIIRSIKHIDSYTPAVTEQINNLCSDAALSALVVDMFCTTVIDVAKCQLGIPTYVFITSAACLLSLRLVIPTINEKHECDFIDLKENIAIPGMANPLLPTELPEPVRRKGNPVFPWFLESISRFFESDGFFVNTFEELETDSLAALKNNEYSPEKKTPPVYPVGPLLALDKLSESSDHECIRWLDSQPDYSVVFLCFGSLGGFTEEQIREIANGLELSGCRFLWAVRIKLPGMSAPEDADLERVLPPRFLDQIKDRGLVWPKWVPQIGILSHRATGGFVSHCGWNSTLESLWFGVPLITWPLYAEQRLNAFFLVKELGLGVGLHKEGLEDNALVLGTELARSIKSLMEEEEGKKVREKTKRMKEAGASAIADGGSSYSSLRMLVQSWTT